jgi:[CysO sulfur-carrier protein]-S-L-cysteine hydrolase
MSQPNVLRLSQSIIEEISQHARSTFPEECCGIIVSNGTTDRALRLKNLQNARHAEDPEKYPRDATIAYSLDELEFESMCLESSKLGFALKAFYHSHPNHDAYFSGEDRAGATPFGEPTYPEAAQIVISVYERSIKTIKAFKWSYASQDFEEAPIEKL